MIIFTPTAIAVLVGSLVVGPAQCARMVKKFKTNDKTSQTLSTASGSGVPQNCFPAVGFETPNEIPTSLTDWWCDADTEYAFVGFSYDISLCDFFSRSMFFIYDAHRDFFQVRVWRI